MSIASQKLQALRARLLSEELPQGALLVVYPPEEELEFRVGYEELIRELQAGGVKAKVLDFRTLLFEVLEAKGLLEKAFQLDASNSRDLRQNLAGMVQREALRHVCAAAKEAPDAILLCAHTAALYPWISYATLTLEIENKVANTLVIPFPGRENGPELKFFGLRNGYNYRAARI